MTTHAPTVCTLHQRAVCGRSIERKVDRILGDTMLTSERFPHVGCNSSSGCACNRMLIAICNERCKPMNDLALLLPPRSSVISRFGSYAQGLTSKPTSQCLHLFSAPCDCIDAAAAPMYEHTIHALHILSISGLKPALSRSSQRCKLCQTPTCRHQNTTSLPADHLWPQHYLLKESHLYCMCSSN